MTEFEVYKKVVEELFNELIDRKSVIVQKVTFQDQLLFNAFRRAYPDLFLKEWLADANHRSFVQQKYLDFLKELTLMGGLTPYV